MVVILAANDREPGGALCLLPTGLDALVVVVGEVGVVVSAEVVVDIGVMVVVSVVVVVTVVVVGGVLVVVLLLASELAAMAEPGGGEASGTPKLV